MGKLFAAISADPPWRFKDAGTRMHPSYSGAQRKARHYNTMSLADICAVDVGAMAAPDALLFLWAPNAMVLEDQAQLVAASWGFVPKQIIPWVKTSAAGAPRIGGGHYTRVCTEQLILCTRGSAAKLIRRHDVPGVIIAPRGKHSAKPDESYRMIEKLVDGDYCELWARRRWSPAWTAIGDQLTGEVLR